MDRERLNSFIGITAKNVAAFIGSMLVEIESRYLWPFDLNSARQLLGHDFSTEKNPYQQTIKLKALLVGKLATSKDFDGGTEYAEYFVQEWGRIGGHNNLRALLEPFYDQRNVDLEQLTLVRSFEGISSWSKYLSLLNSDAAIYDSRVAYSINVINYLGGTTDLFFPMPAGRSPRLSLLDIETLFLLSKLAIDRNFVSDEDSEHKQISARLKKKYQLEKTQTYLLYLELIAEVCVLLNIPKNEHFKIEMLLFALPPGEVFKSLIDAQSESNVAKKR